MRPAAPLYRGGPGAKIRWITTVAGDDFHLRHHADGQARADQPLWRTLVAAGERYADALATSEANAAETGAMQVHAYDQPETLLGQGTVGPELEADQPFRRPTLAPELL